jgi:hypothetical protein
VFSLFFFCEFKLVHMNLYLPYISEFYYKRERGGVRVELVEWNWLDWIGWIGLVGWHWLDWIGWFGLVCFIYFQMNFPTSSVKKISKSQISFEIGKF